MTDRSLGDDDFEYDDTFDNGRTQMVSNQPYDEEVALSDSESHLTRSMDVPPAAAASRRAGDSAKPSYDDLAESSETMGGRMRASAVTSANTGGAALGMQNQASQLTGNSIRTAGYDPSQFAAMTADPALAGLFEYIGQYQPETVALDTELKVFVPEYIPAVGDVDEFLKPARPDGAQEVLGLRVLDEPSATQSDPAIMRRKLKAMTKWSATDAGDETAIEHGDENRDQKIDDWIRNVSQLRESEQIGEFKPKGRFPPIDSLTHSWPEELEPMVRGLRQASSHVDVDMLTLTQTLCNLLDIPVYDNPVESLHCLFTLYVELKNNEYLNPPEMGDAMTGQTQFVNFG